MRVRTMQCTNTVLTFFTEESNSELKENWKSLPGHTVDDKVDLERRSYLLIMLYG